MTKANCTLRRVYLNNGGYEYGKYGRYFGNDAPLYAYDYTAPDHDFGGHVRASSRNAAKEDVRERHPEAVFFDDKRK
jgi:hypothetical protein